MMRAKRTWWWLVGIATLALVGVVAWAIVARPPGAPIAGPSALSASGVFQPTVVNAAPLPGPAPEGMVWIPGGEFSMGAADPHGLDMNDVGMHATDDSRPIHRVSVDGFWVDTTEVTNGEFQKFVTATGYVTVAERTPRGEDFPGAPPEKLVAGSLLFSPPDHPVPLNDQFQWWSYGNGASWRHPLGSASDLNGREHHPAVHIAYDDASAYASWAGKRLPTEAEWEFSARGGLVGKPYVWGDEFRPNGRWMANTYQGSFPNQDTAEDLFSGIGPVAQFPPNGYGLFDVAGSVWEWTSDWYRPDYYAQLATAGGVARNPQGPDSPYDPSEPTASKRVHRGGSFLCTDQYCSRYMVGTRGKGEVSTGTNHLGFRCVRSPTRPRQAARS
ncbi:MAG: formylglycine-generating enzyme family protein [Acidobacteriota bacterium]